MKFVYTPNNLIKTREKIAREHNIVSKETYVTYTKEEIKNLIFRVVGWEKYSVKMNAYSLRDDEVKALIDYIPRNEYGVNLENIFMVYKYRKTEVMDAILYFQWQDYYSNVECNNFIIDLLKYDEKFILFIRNKGLTESAMIKVLSSNNIISALGKEIYDDGRKKGYLSIEKMILNHGIRKESRLSIDIISNFYSYCDRKAYLGVLPEDLLGIIKGYSVEQLKGFLYNFLTEMKLNDLEKYTLLLNYLEGITGSKGTERFRKFFDTFSELLVYKYIQWVGNKKLEILNTERYQFWKQFEKLSETKIYQRSNSIVMEFEDVYISEFLGKAMGPIYVYDKEYFDKKIKKYFSSESNAKLRSLLYNKWKIGEAGILLHREHLPSPGWERYFRRYVIYPFNIKNIKDI